MTPEADETPNPDFGKVLQVKEYPGVGGATTFMELVGGKKPGQAIERVKWQVEKRDGAWGVFPPTSQSPAAHIAGTRAAALKWARNPQEETDAPGAISLQDAIDSGKLYTRSDGARFYVPDATVTIDDAGYWTQGHRYIASQDRFVDKKSDLSVKDVQEASSEPVPEADTPDVEGPGSDPTPSFEAPVTQEAPAGAEAQGLDAVPEFARSLVGPGDKVYTHPQGSVIIVDPTGAVAKIGPDGKPRKTSATAAKLSVGHGGWSPVEISKPAPVAKPTEPDLAPKPMTDYKPAEAIVVAAEPEPELPSAPAPKSSKPRVPMTFEEAPVVDVPKYIEDPDYFFQQKVDGIRGQLVIEPGKTPWFRSKSGDKLVSSTAAKITVPMLTKIGAQPDKDGPSYTVDGELLDGKWYVFDIAVDGSEKVPWEDRAKMAEAWVNEMHKAGIMNIQTLPVARTADEKRELWEAVNASGAEGVMMKRRDAGYDYGKRVTHTVKAKVTSTVDVVVLERNINGKENARIGLMVDGKPVTIGTVSMQGKEKFGKVNVGDVIEVEYLWAMPGTMALQQPRMVKRRPDKKQEEAVGDQLRFVDKAIVDIGAPKPAATPAPVVVDPTPAPAPASTPTALSPAPVPEADVDPVSAAVAAFEAERPNAPQWKIVGDPTSDEWFMKKTTKASLSGEDLLETYMVTATPDGAVTVRSDDGKERPLSGMFPDLWKAVTADKPRSYADKLDASFAKDWGFFGGWSDTQIRDATADMGMPYRPYPPGSYGTNKEMNAYSQASTRWDSELVKRLKAGGPPKVEVRVGTDASDAELQAELKRLSALSAIAHAEDARVQDKAAKYAIDALDNYASGMSREEVGRIRDAAAPLRAELMRRLADSFVDSGDDNDPRWASTSKPATTHAPGGASADTQDKARNTYVVNDANTVEKNASLRSNAPSAAAKTWRGKTDKWVKSNMASHDMVLNRGIAVSPDVLRQFQVGATITDPGIVSSDESQSTAEFYLSTRLATRPDAVPVMLEIRTPKGTRVVDAGYGEFVFPSSSKFLVRRVYNDNGTYRIVVEVQP